MYYLLLIFFDDPKKWGNIPILYEKTGGLEECWLQVIQLQVKEPDSNTGIFQSPWIFHYSLHSLEGASLPLEKCYGGQSRRDLKMVVGSSRKDVFSFKKEGDYMPIKSQ